MKQLFMTQKYESQPHAGPDMDKAELDCWARRGTKTAAFLLVIPGATTIGYGIGLFVSKPMPSSVIGLGAGLLLWGLIVALTD
jgi:hypothetical protein